MHVQQVPKRYLLFSFENFSKLSGYIGDRMELRHFLSGSTILYAISCYMFGVGRNWGIHNIWYYYIIMGIQVGNILTLLSMSHPSLQGCLASTGWPGVMAGFGPWVGQSARGFIMGVWQSNAYVGNIIGRELARSS